MADHSLLSPSKMKLILACPFVLTIKDKEPPNEAASRGTKLHEAMERYVKDGESLPDDFSLDLARKYIELLVADENVEINCEERVFFGDLFGVMDGAAFGTSDIVAYNKKHNVLFVCDYKFGRIPVKCKNNIQLAIYAYGAMRKYPFAETVSMSIIQPTQGEDCHSNWVVSREELLAFLESNIAPRRNEIMEWVMIGNDLCLTKQAGEHCRGQFCKNTKGCDTYFRYLFGDEEGYIK